jgi:hypothetical protein
MKASVHIDIVDNDRPTWSQISPGSVHLKSNIPFAVQTVMDEKINLAEAGK